MKERFYVKKEGIVSESSADIVEAKTQDKECHLCGKCLNAEPNKCLKVKDVLKKSINDYDFILAGEQSFDEDGNSDILIVEECKNFIPIVEKKKTKEQKEKYKKLKHSIACLYFDTATPEEAYLLQMELYERGHLTGINKAHFPSKKTIESMKQRVRK